MQSVTSSSYLIDEDWQVAPPCEKNCLLPVPPLGPSHAVQRTVVQESRACTAAVQPGRSRTGSELQVGPGSSRTGSVDTAGPCLQTPVRPPAQLGSRQTQQQQQDKEDSRGDKEDSRGLTVTQTAATEREHAVESVKRARKRGARL